MGVTSMKTVKTVGTAKKRLGYFIAFLVFFLIELLIALYIRDRFIRPYMGDMLVVVVVYCFIRIFIPDRHRLLPLYVFLFAAGIEALQYLQLVKVLGLEHNAVLRTVLGSVFDWKDIGCYAAGCTVVGVFEFWQNRKKDRYE